MEASQSLAELDWIPRPRLLALRRLRIETVEDLLTHFPRRHEDRHEFPEFPREESEILRGFTLGAEDYVIKPFSAIELAVRLKRLIAG